MKCNVRLGFLPSAFAAAALAALLLAALPSCAGAPRGDMWSLLARGDERAMEFFLGEFDARARDSEGRTPLHYAAALNDPALSRFFIAMGAELDARDNSAQTPLGLAAEMGHLEAAGAIAAAGADIHSPAAAGISPAAKSLEGECRELLRAILSPASIGSADPGGSSILHMASAAGCAVSVGIILEELRPLGGAGAGRALAAAGSRDTPLDQRDSAGRNPLDLAVARPDSRDHMEAAGKLILAGAVSQGPVYRYLAPAARSANYDLRRASGTAPLHFAAAHGHAGLIEFLLGRGANPSIQNPSGATPLHEAARAGSASAARLLLEGGADAGAQDAAGNTALHLASPPDSHAAMIRLLLGAGLNPNARDAHGDSPLHVLVTLNRGPEVARALLAGGPGGSPDVAARNIRGQTALHVAVREGRLQLVPLLLAAGSDIFAADNSGVTPFHLALERRGAVLNALITPETARQADSAGNTILHIAIQSGVEAQTIGLMLERGAAVNARNRDGDTPLHIAARLNRREAGEYILARGADVFSANFSGDSPLRIALPQRGAPLGWMFSPGTIRSRDGMGNTMLHYVALWRKDRHIPFMIQQGISADAANATGETPLFWAVHHDGASTARALLGAGASLHARDSLGNSALHSAVRWNAVSATNALLDAGIGVNVHSLSGTTPLHDSVRLGNTAIAAILISRGAGLEVRDSGGNTPFMEAVRAGHSEAAALLASRGADPMTRNLGGDTPLHFAVAAADHGMTEALLGMGVSIHARNTLSRTPFQAALSGPSGALPALLAGGRANAADDFGNSPLHVAVQEGVSPEALRAIVAKGSRLSAVDSNGRIPLRLAVDMGAWDLAKVLADSGSDPFMAAVDEVTSGEIAIASGRIAIESVFSGRAINARDPSGNTALHHAARMGRSDAISLLLGLGADMGARNISEESPADMALRWNNHESARLLN